MKVKIFLLFLCCFFDGYSAETAFVIVITSHNAKGHYQKNLDSVFNQSYSNYRIIYLADGSTDGSDELAEQYIKTHSPESLVTFFKTRSQKGSLACMCQAAFSCNKDEVVIELDGNDWFPHCNTLSYLNTLYANTNIWMTYGNRVAQRTFYAALFQAIDKEDFLDEYTFRSDDWSYFIPMLDMAGEHAFTFGNELIHTNQKYGTLAQLPLNKHIAPIYEQISDLLHPTADDYRNLQEHLLCGTRENLDRLGSMTHLMRQIKLIGDLPDEVPISGCIPVNCQDTDRDNCILIYATFNRNYPNALKRLLKHIVESDYQGHVFYRLGGWPNTEGGSLTLAEVPYGFKCSFFKEAQKLGFKRILWLDSAVVPIASLNTIFDMIQKKGYFVLSNPCVIGPFMNRQAAAYFGLTIEHTFQIPSCAAGLLGVDLFQILGVRLLDSWYRAAHDKDAFFSIRSDQNALSILLYQYRLFDFTDIRRMPHAKNQIQSDSLFFLDRGFTRQ